MTPEPTYDDGNVICPYCGKSQQDSWELGNGGAETGITECSECEKEFKWEREISVSYIGRGIK